MAERADLEAAADAGVIAREQVDPLLTFLAQRRAPAATALPGEEDLRFIRNFHDVFLAIGIVLFAIGMAIGIGVTVGERSPDTARGALFLTGGLTAGAASVLWLLGEFFARRRRLFLPSIAIVCAFTGFAAAMSLALYSAVVAGSPIDLDFTDTGLPPVVRIGFLVAGLALVLAPLAFYLRFRLPFSMGLTGAGAAAFAVIAAMVADHETTMRFLPALLLALGVALFVAGVVFDARDPARQTRLSDNGFWLHFAAAPLLLNGAFGLLGQLFGVPNSAEGAPPSAALAIAGEEGGAAAQAAATLLVVLFLGLVSLLINRRALIVSALLTTGVAIGVLMNAVGLDAGALAASTFIVLGGFVLILGAGWHGVRRALLGWVKPDGVWARIFPPETPATA
jgi:hypothetical protein